MEFLQLFAYSEIWLTYLLKIVIQMEHIFEQDCHSSD